MTIERDDLEIAVFVNGKLDHRINESRFWSTGTDYISYDKILDYVNDLLMNQEMEDFTLISGSAPDGYGIITIYESKFGHITFDWGK